MSKEMLLHEILSNVALGKIEKRAGANLLELLKKIGKDVDDDIAIIGMSVNLPKAQNIDEYWEILENGVDCISEFPEERKADIDRYLKFMDEYENVRYCKGAYLNEIDKFDYSYFKISPREASLMNPNQRLLLQNVCKTIEDAGYSKKSIKGTKTGVYIGYSGDEIIDYKKYISDVDSSVISEAFAGNLSSVIAGRIAYFLDLKGPSVIIDTACSSSLVAIHTACQSILNGECEMAIAGGVRINLIRKEGTFDIGISASDDKTKAFDNSSNGTSSGEGVASILLKPLKKAIKDNDNIHAVIKGSAINHDGTSMGLTVPNVLSQEDVILTAWKNARIDPETISYIEAHGTGTELGDPIEVDGIERAFRRYTSKKQFCAIGSVKTNLGHLDHGSGIVSLIKCVVSLKNKKIPATLNFNRPNKKIDFINSPVYVNNMLRYWERTAEPRRCGISGFGISGTNCHIILEEIPELVNRYVEDINKVKIITFSAKNEDILKKLINDNECFFNNNLDININDACYTSNVGRDHHECRLTILFRTREELIEILRSINQSSELRVNHPKYSYGKYKLVPNNKENKESFEITSNEIGLLSKNANELLIKIINANEEEKLDILKELSGYYIKGADINWNKLHGEKNLRKISLPTYPFEKKRCWIEFDIENNKNTLTKESIYNSRVWHKNKLKSKNKVISKEQQILILKDDKDIDCLIINELKEYGYKIVVVDIKDKYEKINDNYYTIKSCINDYEKIFAEVKNISKIINLSALAFKSEANNIEQLNERLNHGIYSFLDMIKVLAKNNDTEEIDIIIIAANTELVSNTEDEIYPENSTLFGLAKVVNWENHNLKCRCIDVDKSTTIESLINEITTNSNDFKVAYRRDIRYIEVLEKLELEERYNEPLKINKNGAYIITGGTGAIGLKMAKFLVNKGAKKLALINRSKLPIRDKWDEILKISEDKKLCEKLLLIRSLEKEGVEVESFTCDVADYDSMKDTINCIRAKFTNINGVIHCAGIGDGTLIEFETKESLEATLKSKVHGTWILDKLTKNDNLEFFITCSSAITLIGGLGGGGYTAANSYLNSFAAKHKLKSIRSLAINWPSWDETGLSEGVDNYEDKQVFKIISPNEAMVSFGKIVDNNFCEVILGKINYECTLLQREDILPFNISKDIKNNIPKLDMNKINNKKSRKIKPVNTELSGRTDNYTENEVLLGSIWGEVLGLDEINIYENFYELGGDSLIATRILNLINKKAGVTIGIQDFFKNTNIHDLAKCLSDKKLSYDNCVLKISKAKKLDYYPISSAQKRLYILNQFDKDSVHYNEPSVMRICGKLNKEDFENAIYKLIERHDSLRTSFKLVNNEPVQKIEDNIEFKINYLSSDEDHISEIIKKSIKPFKLNEGPLMRVSLITTSKDRHLLIFDMHHIICDGTSMHILLEDFIALYKNKVVQPLNLQYTDFSIWQEELFNTDEIKRQEEYWLKLFEGEIPVLNLPLDYQRPGILNYNGAEVEFSLDKEWTSKLNSLISKMGVTSYMALLATFTIMLQKYTNQDDIVVGTPVEGRNNADLQNIIGIFVNTLAMRNKPEDNKTFNDFIVEVKENSLKAYENQDFQFEKLVENLKLDRDVSRNALFDVMFALHYYKKNQMIDLGDIKITPYEFENKISKFDLSLIAVENDGAISLKLEYSTVLFKKQTIERMASTYINILKQIITNPNILIRDINLMETHEKENLLETFNNTNKEYSNKSIVRLFEEQVEKTPNRVAVECGILRLTYKELNQRANSLAVILREKGVCANSIVGIMADRSLEMVVAIIGILKAGAAYLPIDPHYPEDRIQYMLENSNASIVLTNGEGNLSYAYKGEVLNINSSYLYSNNNDNLGLDESGEDLVYVIYTSGTTGKPKGVMVKRNSFVNLVDWYIKDFQFSEKDNVLLLASISFDLAQKNIYAPLLTGGKLVLIKENFIDYRDVVDIIKKSEVTVVNCTPSAFNPILNFDVSNNYKSISSLRCVFLGGESIKLKPMEEWMNSSAYNAEVINTYGPTECTDIATYYRIKNEDIGSLNSVPIGKPINNVRIYIIDKFGRELPIGIPGELCIGGVGVSRGYYNDMNLTNEKFVCYDNLSGTKVYRTGDLAKWLDDGNIELLGRMDYQVKIRGFRIETGEIESKFLEINGIKEAVVTDVGNDGDKFLCVYYIGDINYDTKDLINELKINLPEYMVPLYYVKLEAMPLTSNGKIDRKSLPIPNLNREISKKPEQPRNSMEQKMVEIWRDILEVNSIGINENFFEIGGHSLRATSLMLEISKNFNVNVPLIKIFALKTVKALCEYISSVETTEYKVIKKAEEKEYFKVSSAQSRMYMLQNLDDSGVAYNITVAFEIKGKIDCIKLQESFVKLISRHESLRTSFEEYDNQIVQKIHETEDVKFEVHEYIENDEKNVKHIINSFIKPFRLDRAPLFRVGVIKISETRCILVLDTHHIIADGSTMAIISHEFSSIYSGNELKVINLQYKDYSEWQNKFIQSSEYKKQEEYWLSEFQGNIKPITIPTDYHRPSVKSNIGDSINFNINKDKTMKLRKIANETGSTMNMILISIFKVLLSKYSNQEEVIIGSAVSGRNYNGLDDVVGMFVNTLAIKSRIKSEDTFIDYLNTVKNKTLQAMENQDYQFDELINKLDMAKDLSRNPLFDFMFIMQNTMEAILDVEDLSFNSYNFASKTEKFDISMSANESEENINMVISYSVDLFKKETIESFKDNYIKILDQIIYDPSIKVSNIELNYNYEFIDQVSFDTDFNF
ncbi:hybrid non-ribosomal peptide synthetase/type I polyketide synthase [Clostridium botulinum]|uniref:hybrid non-ribosomal peptide synthetase/type I polyketide synthase n=1 Tax=Clostridium botulinum TaxID=1491 RepID=UPI0019678F41|nr:non-ribosomal peptide synthetase [Clostridium botulinum]MBN1050267.1 amino acid adenylation domain-containing protein [Clostridium botulinum]